MNRHLISFTEPDGGVSFRTIGAGSLPDPVEGMPELTMEQVNDALRVIVLEMAGDHFGRRNREGIHRCVDVLARHIAAVTNDRNRLRGVR